MPNTENSLMPEQRIIVIGASAGGFDAIKKIVSDLPASFEAPIFIVWHMAPEVSGVMPTVLNKLNSIYAAHAYDREKIKQKRIYVAPPDHHLIIEDDYVRLARGPKENYFRPAVDPLFRSAAYHYGNRVIGVVLSGALDDGTAGLWRIKNNGGIAIVQHPYDAEVPSMPENALREVAVDYSVPVAELASLLVRLTNEPLVNAPVMNDEKTKIEIGIAAGEQAYERGSLKIGELSPFSCPECHGVLSKIVDGDMSRFRCHTGHAYSADTLLAAISDKIEGSLYTAMGGMEESMLLLNHLGDHLAEINHPKLAALYFKKAKEAADSASFIRTTVMGYEQLSNSRLLRELEDLKEEIER